MLSAVPTDTLGEPFMGLDHISLITLSRHSLRALFKVGAQGTQIDLSGMWTYAHHQYDLDVQRHQMISMVVDTFAAPVLILTCWAKSSN
jgi:hypothetical protein